MGVMDSDRDGVCLGVDLGVDTAERFAGLCNRKLIIFGSPGAVKFKDAFSVFG